MEQVAQRDKNILSWDFHGSQPLKTYLPAPVCVPPLSTEQMSAPAWFFPCASGHSALVLAVPTSLLFCLSLVLTGLVLFFIILNIYIFFSHCSLCHVAFYFFLQDFLKDATDVVGQLWHWLELAQRDKAWHSIRYKNTELFVRIVWSSSKWMWEGSGKDR